MKLGNFRHLLDQFGILLVLLDGAFAHTAGVVLLGVDAVVAERMLLRRRMT